MRFDDFGKVPVFIICMMEQGEVYPRYVETSEETAGERALSLVDDALPHNAVFVFRVLLREKEWNMRAAYYPDGEAIAKRDPSHACAGGLFEQNEFGNWICNRCGDMWQ